MCGIAGAIYTETGRHDAVGVVNEVLREQRGRGPDHSGSCEIRPSPIHSVILGHTRLKITDLSDQANQPMWDVTGQYVITFNGEIYNHGELREELISLGYRFRTKSDTEVVLNAFIHWGMESTHRFIGSFAFAIVGLREGKCFLVRDRFGKCPLNASPVSSAQARRD